MVPNKYSHTKERRTISCLLVRASIKIYKGQNTSVSPFP